MSDNHWDCDEEEDEEGEQLRTHIRVQERCESDKGIPFCATGNASSGQATPQQNTQCAGEESCQSRPSYTIEQLKLVEDINSCENVYQMLGVSRTACMTEIKKSFKKLALKLHPDKNEAPGAAEAFKRINNAVSLLTNRNSKNAYDVKSQNGGTGSQSSKSKAHRRPRAHFAYRSFHHDHADNWETDEDYFGEWVRQHRNATSYSSSNHVGRSVFNFYHPNMMIVLLLLIVCLATFLSFFLTKSHYSLYRTSRFSSMQHTQRLKVPYYVQSDFLSTYKGSIEKLEHAVEEDFIITAREQCYRQRSHLAGEIDELIEKLKAVSVSPDGSEKDTSTTSLLSEISATKDPKLFDKHELAEFFLKLAQAQDVDVRREAAKCIAEITKSEIQRAKFTKREIIAVFVDFLRNVNENTENLELPIQICRALGNICYLNDEAHDLILDLKGDEVLIKLLDITNIRDTKNALQFIKVRGGLLSNYLLVGEGLANRAVELGIMPKLQKIISIGVEKIDENEDLLLNTLPLLSALTENVNELNFEPSLNIQLSRILAASTNPDLAEMCLELLHYQAENDDVKLLLAEDGLCETIYNILEKYKNLASTNEARALMKLACELIVLILTGDESMHFLYNTNLLKNMEDWLDSSDIDLLTTGVLALGNFARTDSHCIYMVENKIVNKLLDVLAKNNGVDDDVRLQHALLSALRNLVIPKPNKDAIIQSGLVNTILPMLAIHQPPVVFKLLGTLRMTVDGQDKLALDLLKNKTLIEQLVVWSKSSDYAGVTGESLRLMAWLIKHAYLSKIAYSLPRKGDVPPEQLPEKMKVQDYDRSNLRDFMRIIGTIEAMVNMLTSQHLVMQNEGLIALCILTFVFLTDSIGVKEDAQYLESELIKHSVGKKLTELIQKSADSMTKEIVENLQNLVNLLRKSEALSKHLEEHNIDELLKTIPILTEYCTL